MKRFTAIILTLLLLVTSFAGCGKSEKRKLFNVNLKKYVTLGDYKGFKIDANSEEISGYISEINESSLSQSPKQVTEGVVEDGDTVNIDYEGSVDGVAFTGGTSQGYDLKIGSGTFIEGFESQLIGKEIGSTVNVNVTFPEGYQDSTDMETGSKVITLSNTPAVFKVKINYKSVIPTEVDEDVAIQCGFNSLDEYIQSTKESAVKNYIADTIIGNAEINSYPDKDFENYYDAVKGYYTEYAQQNGATFEDFLSYNGVAEDDFKRNVKESFLKTDIVFYAILDKEKLTVTEDEVNAKINEMVTNFGTDEATLKQYYARYGGDYYFEAMVVQDKVMDLIIDSSEITY